MGTLFYFLYILVVIGLYLTTTPFGILNISYHPQKVINIYNLSYN